VFFFVSDASGDPERSPWLFFFTKLGCVSILDSHILAWCLLNLVKLFHDFFLNQLHTEHLLAARYVQELQACGVTDVVPNVVH
jgi:hypothetical protein